MLLISGTWRSPLLPLERGEEGSSSLLPIGECFFRCTGGSTYDGETRGDKPIMFKEVGKEAGGWDIAGSCSAGEASAYA